MKYSDEKGTKAFSMRKKVPPRIAEDRCERAVDAASRILRAQQKKMIGCTVEVMLDEEGAGTWYARLPTQAPEQTHHPVSIEQRRVGLPVVARTIHAK